MASFSVDGTHGLDGFSRLLEHIGHLPDDVKTNILKAMGEVSKDAQVAEGKSMGIYDYDGESAVHVLDNAKVNKPALTDEGGYVTVTYTGSRKRGNTTTRNAEIAFINEFGANDKGIKPRPFVKTANEKNADKIYKAGEAVFDKWLYKDTNLK